MNKARILTPDYLIRKEMLLARICPSFGITGFRNISVPTTSALVPSDACCVKWDLFGDIYASEGRTRKDAQNSDLPGSPTEADGTTSRESHSRGSGCKPAQGMQKLDGINVSLLCQIFFTALALLTVLCSLSKTTLCRV